MRPLGILASVAVAATMLPGVSTATTTPTCAPGGPTVELAGMLVPADEGTYQMLPFTVTPGTTRLEVGYEWSDRPVAGLVDVGGQPGVGALTDTVLDLGLWEGADRGADAFRGWSGSRQGRLHEGQGPVWIQADSAERGYRPGAPRPGPWWVELGAGHVGPTGADFRVEITCSDVAVGPPFVADPVDATHVANAGPGVYHADFHMHGYHSNPNGPEWSRLVAEARAAGLDVLPITDYVTPAHWDELGAIQRANPDLLVWPGREVITYAGHAIVVGETRDVLDHRDGWKDVTLAGILADVDRLHPEALVSLAHPTFFPGPLAPFCRGCHLDAAVDVRTVDMMEVQTGPADADLSDLGGPGTASLGLTGPNPFNLTALGLWDHLLRAGHKITAVSGSDSKGQEPDDAERRRRGYGSSATAVLADELSREGIAEAIRAGRAYVRTRGVHGSPEMDLVATDPDGTTGTYGSSFAADRATVTVTVRGGRGQVLVVLRDGLPVSVSPILDDEATHTFEATRSSHHGPLGTYWRVEVRDLLAPTVIGNPIFLTGP